LDRGSRSVVGAINSRRSSYGSALTPVASNSNAVAGLNSNTTPGRSHRNSLSPSPLTPRSSYRRGSAGLRGRKSTSSSVSSVRSMPRHTSHSKASSQSSNSLDTIHSPKSRSAARSPHSSIKVLPVTPTVNAFPSNVRMVRKPHDPDASSQPRPLSGIRDDASNPAGTPHSDAFGSGLVFAKRKKTAFKGPLLNAAFFSGSSVPATVGSPAFVGGRNREGSDGRMNLGFKELMGRRGSGKRKSQIIEEEEEDEDEAGHGAIGEEDEEEIEEVDAFQAIRLNKGERVESITIWNDAVEDPDVGADEADKSRK